MDLSKDSLYCDDQKSLEARSKKTAMLYIARNLSHLLAPILTYTIDEVIEFAPDIFKKDDIVDVFDLKTLDFAEVMEFPCFINKKFK